ncbi:MAG: hypothetical protein ACK47D_01180 [Pseudanabaena sp.]|nr:hypothetical protein [Pseudanabaena mucicola]MCA6504595.1 hypothetical protein [Pseudanabaena sp. M090S1SP2A07QC]MCA6523845.1 hypothetical protein [Pseudanabaena sp. M051S1SP2A07QC]MCA6575362.1 hypothetical protein [Pseudanabaena sp. M53BS1SP1A06MG]MCA6582265.1 hypothetical protein [Pseudanabaena sp. M34BS1SP1A06MG]MCA6593833.1 hypothetical protein [Pseudanabaena sp. M38BS1SP1A06MG]MCA6597726.1 hypothetical protein [Pseudanabaena sp. M046S1SP1A06QC]MCA6600846.1 hypothetical protein [Pseud
MRNSIRIAKQSSPWRSPTFLMIVGLIGLVIVLEFSTPPEYVMGEHLN